MLRLLGTLVPGPARKSSLPSPYESTGWALACSSRYSGGSSPHHHLGSAGMVIWHWCEGIRRASMSTLDSACLCTTTLSPRGGREATTCCFSEAATLMAAFFIRLASSSPACRKFRCGFRSGCTHV